MLPLEEKPLFEPPFENVPRETTSDARIGKGFIVQWIKALMPYRDSSKKSKSPSEDLKREDGFSATFAKAYEEYVNEVQKPGLAYLEKEDEIPTLAWDEKTAATLQQLVNADRILSAAKRIEKQYGFFVVKDLKKEGDPFYDLVFGKEKVASSEFSQSFVAKRKEASAGDRFILFQAKIRWLLEQVQDYPTFLEALEALEEYKDVDTSGMEKEEKDFLFFLENEKKNILAIEDIVSRLLSLTVETYDGEKDSYADIAKRFDKLFLLEREIFSLDPAIYSEERTKTLRQDCQEALLSNKEMLDEKIRAFLDQPNKTYEDFIAFDKEFKPIGFQEKYDECILLPMEEYQSLARHCQMAKSWKELFVDSFDLFAHPKEGLSRLKEFDEEAIGPSYQEAVNRCATYRKCDRESDIESHTKEAARGIGKAALVILNLLWLILPLLVIGYQCYESVLELLGDVSTAGAGNWIGSIIGGIFYGLIRGIGSLFGLPFFVPSFYHITLFPSLNLFATDALIVGVILLASFIVFAILEYASVDYWSIDFFLRFLNRLFCPVLFLGLLLLPFAVCMKEAIVLLGESGFGFLSVSAGVFKGMEAVLLLLVGGAFFRPEYFAGWGYDPVMASIMVWVFFALFIGLFIFLVKATYELEDVLFDGADLNMKLFFWLLFGTFFLSLFFHMLFSAAILQASAEVEDNPGAIGIILGIVFGIPKALFSLIGAPFYMTSWYADYPVSAEFMGATGLLHGYGFLVFHLINKNYDMLEKPQKVFTCIFFFAIFIGFLAVPLFYPTVLGALSGDELSGTMALAYGLIGKGIGDPSSFPFPNALAWNIFLYLGVLTFVPSLILQIKLRI